MKKENKWISFIKKEPEEGRIIECEWNDGTIDDLMWIEGVINYELDIIPLRWKYKNKKNVEI